VVATFCMIHAIASTECVILCVAVILVMHTAAHFDSSRNMVALVAGRRRWILSHPRVCTYQHFTIYRLVFTVLGVVVYMYALPLCTVQCARHSTLLTNFVLIMHASSSAVHAHSSTALSQSG
jgi:hypothetical protein